MNNKTSNESIEKMVSFRELKKSLDYANEDLAITRGNLSIANEDLAIANDKISYLEAEIKRLKEQLNAKCY